MLCQYKTFNPLFTFSFLLFILIFSPISLLHAQDWAEVLNAEAPDRAANDRFGNAVSVSGNYAIIGEYYEDHDAAGANSLGNAGAVYFFERIGGTWTQVQNVVASDRAANDEFGYRVSISGNYAIVGARYEDQDAAGANTMADAGSCYMFERIGGTWTEVQKIVASDRAAGDEFGVSVSISGDYAIVGARNEDEDEAGANTLSDAGAVYFFERIGGTWTEVQKRVASDRAVEDRLGISISISGEYAIVGASVEDEDVAGANTFASAGSAYLFERVGGTWTEVQKVVASDRAGDDNFGISVSISGDYAVIGARTEDEDVAGANTLADAGSAYIFERSGGTWTEVQKIVNSDRDVDDRFGYSVAISGNYVVVGAHREDENASGGSSLPTAGSAYLFERIGGTWTQVQKVVASDRGSTDNFGFQVAISGHQSLIGASFEHSAQGRAYFFQKPWVIFPHGGYALDFDGTDDYVEIPYDADLNSTNFTVEGWVKVEGGAGTYRAILSSRDVPGGNTQGFTLYATDVNTWELWTGDNSGFWVETFSGLITDSWNHIAFSYDGTDLRWYINGLLVQTVTTSFTPNAAQPFRIGAGTNEGAASQFFPGKVDEVRIWNDVRTQAEIQASMSKELTGDEVNLAAYYQMYDSTGVSLTDISHNRNTGTLTNGPAWKTSGALAGSDMALGFDGTDDYVFGSLNATPSSRYTLEGWFSFGVLGSQDNIMRIHHTANSDIRVVPYKTASDSIYFYLHDGTSSYNAKSNTKITQTDSWYHLAFIYDGGNVSFYVNGVAAGTDISLVNVNMVASGAFSIGADYDGVNSGFHSQAKIDEVRIWNEDRTETEIRANMYHTLRGDEANLVAYYRFDQQADAGNTFVYDLTANSNNGTLTNMDGTSDWVTSNPFNTWIGSEDTDWTNGENWSTGAVPTSTIDIGLYTWSGNNTPSLSGTANGRNMYIDSDVTFSNTGTATLTGNLLNEGTSYGSGSTVFSGTSAQVIAGGGTTTFGVLTIDNATGVGLEKDVTTSSLALTDGAFSIGSQTLTVNGGITKTSGGLTGGATSSMVIGGAGASTELPIVTLNNLTLNRSNGITTEGAVSINGILTLTDGIFDLGSDFLILGDAATVAGSPGTSNHVDATSGNIQKGFTSDGNFTYPVGDGTVYTPIDLDFTASGYSSANATVNLTASKHPNNSSPTHFIDRYWTVTSSGITSFSCDVSATYDDSDINGDESTMHGGKWDGSAWTGLGDVTSGSNLITGTVTSFSDFTAGEEATFPVEWLHVDAKPEGNDVLVDWATAQEFNTDFYEIERSKDQNTWIKLGQVAAAGTASQPTRYHFTDKNPINGTASYRIRQVDIDGQVDYSPIVEITILENGVAVFPNPVKGILTIDLGQKLFLDATLVDMTGRVVLEKRLQPGSTRLQLHEIPSGTYILKLKDGLGWNKEQKILKQ